MSSTFGTSSYPIHNGLSIKLNVSPIKRGEAKSFGALFAKVPQEITPGTANRREMLNKHFSQLPHLGKGCTNQIARIVFPFKSSDYNDTTTWGRANFINIPIIKQPFTDYKILVATAPPHLKIGDDGKPVVIYVVFSDDSTMDETGSLKVPSIYFVNKADANLNLEAIDKKDKFDPVIIIDSNRTVTGFNSKHISKYVNFKNKLYNRYNYKVAP